MITVEPIIRAGGRTGKDTIKMILSGKYKRSDVVVSKIPGRAGIAALCRRIMDCSATPQMDA